MVKFSTVCIFYVILGWCFIMCAHLTECDGYDIKLQSHHTLYIEQLLSSVAQWLRIKSNIRVFERMWTHKTFGIPSDCG